MSDSERVASRESDYGDGSDRRMLAHRGLDEHPRSPAMAAHATPWSQPDQASSFGGSFDATPSNFSAPGHGGRDGAAIPLPSTRRASSTPVSRQDSAGELPAAQLGPSLPPRLESGDDKASSPGDSRSSHVNRRRREELDRPYQCTEPGIYTSAARSDTVTKVPYILYMRMAIIVHENIRLKSCGSISGSLQCNRTPRRARPQIPGSRPRVMSRHGPH